MPSLANIFGRKQNQERQLMFSPGLRMFWQCMGCSAGERLQDMSNLFYIILEQKLWKMISVGLRWIYAFFLNI